MRFSMVVCVKATAMTLSIAALSESIHGFRTGGRCLVALDALPRHGRALSCVFCGRLRQSNCYDFVDCSAQ